MASSLGPCGSLGRLRRGARASALASGLVLVLGASRARAFDDDEKPGTLSAPTVFIGGRTTMTAIQSGTRRETSYGGLFVTSASFHGTQGTYSSLRGSFIGAIGSGTATVEGWLRGALTFGLLLPLLPRRGFFARVGFGGELQGNANYYFSRLEIPLGEVGWQYVEGERLIEVGVRSAPVLAGLYHVEGTHPRSLGISPEYGAYFSARTVGLRSEISAVMIDQSSRAAEDIPPRPVQMFRILICGFGIGGALTMCGDGQIMRVPSGGYSEGPLAGSRVFYLGLTLGIGQTFRPPRTED